MKNKITKGHLFPTSFFGDFFADDFFNFPKTECSVDKVKETIPAINVHEHSDHFDLEVAAPGMKKEDFQVELDKNILTISSAKNKKVEEKNKAGNIIRSEFSYSSFRRSFSLPKGGVKIDEIGAKYEDGILRLTLPKKLKEKKVEKKKIVVA